MGSQGGKAWEVGDEPTKADSQMVFNSIHHHTTFSYKDGYGTPDHHVRRQAELGLPKIFFTEHGNVSSHVQAEQAATKYGQKVGFGCELYTGGVMEDDRTQRKNHLTVLAETDEGYKNLLRIVSRAWAEGFHYEPTASGAMLAEHKEGLIVTSGCSGSLLATSLIGGKNVPVEEASYDRAKKVAARFLHTFGDGYYLEVQAFPELEATKNINRGLAQMSEELGIPLVASLDVHYTTPEESEMQQILHNVRGGMKKSMEDLAKAWSYEVKLCPITDKQIYRRLIATGLTKRQAEQAIRNTAVIGERCNVTLPKVENLRYPLPGGMNDPVELFRRWVNDGWKYRSFSTLPQDERKRYIERVKYEMSLIEEKGFVDYFLVVSDAVRFAKDSGIPVGPARGSAAASLVCYLLRITEVNPMLFPTLLFERFIDRNRHDLPDIDLDFDDERRDEVRDYLVTKYGDDRVGNIGTFTKYKGKNSIDDICRVYRIPDTVGDELKGLLIERSSGDLRAASTIADSVEMFDRAREIVDEHPELWKATLLEGNYRDMSVHAAGLVIANGPLSDFCAVYTRTDDDGVTTQVVSLDKHDAEYLNVMKLDNLSLKTMGAIAHSLREIDMKLEELYAIPLDDERTIQGFRDGDVVGIFQFDGRAMRSVNTGVVPDNFMEIADVNALARPGPLHSGATAEYIDVKHGRKEATHYHEIIDDITKHTNFQIVYQEQILQVVRLLGGFSWEEAARIRKIISKKRGEQEFNTMRAKFIEGSAAHDLSPEDADKVFSMLATAGAYAFNAAHCVSYGMLAYWTMWLKQNHPEAFYVGALRKVGTDKKGKAKLGQLLRDTRKHSIPVLKMNMNRSDLTWTSDPDGGLRPGFIQMHGIGHKMGQRILQERDEIGGFSGWEDVRAIHGIGPAKEAAIKDFISAKDPFELDLLSDTIHKVKSALDLGELADEHGVLPAPTHRSIDVPYDRGDSNLDVVWLGVIRDRNLKDLFELHHSKTGEVLDPNSVKDPHKNEWVVMMGEDETEPIVVTVDRWRYEKFKDTVWSIDLDKDLVLVRGFKYGIQSRRAIYVTDLWVLSV